MNENRLRQIFPRASKAFVKANADELRSEKPKPDSRTPLERVLSGKEKGNTRTTLRYRIFSVRPLDFENAAGATKPVTDALCRCGLLSGDSPTQIEYQLTQEKVATYAEERTEIEIIYP